MQIAPYIPIFLTKKKNIKTNDRICLFFTLHNMKLFSTWPSVSSRAWEREIQGETANGYMVSFFGRVIKIFWNYRVVIVV